MVYEVASWILLLYLLFLLAAFCFFCFHITKDKKNGNETEKKIEGEVEKIEIEKSERNFVKESVPLISNALSKEVGEKEADDLKKIKGIGVKLEKLLNSLGVYTFKQIAEWSKEDVEKVDAYLKFPGRIERDEWIKQAKRLMKEKEKEV